MTKSGNLGCMKFNPPRKLSASLALEGLQEAAEEVWALERALDEARAVRDELVADAVYADVSVARISRITKLSRQYIYRLAPGKVRDDD